MLVRGNFLTYKLNVFLYATNNKVIVIFPSCKELMLDLELIILTGNDKSVDTVYKSRDQLVLCLKTFKGFKLFLTIAAGIKNKIRNDVNRLGWRKTFGIVILV